MDGFGVSTAEADGVMAVRDVNRPSSSDSGSGVVHGDVGLGRYFRSHWISVSPSSISSPSLSSFWM